MTPKSAKFFISIFSGSCMAFLHNGHLGFMFNHSRILQSSNVWPQTVTKVGSFINSCEIGQIKYSGISFFFSFVFSFFYSFFSIFFSASIILSFGYSIFAWPSRKVFKRDFWFYFSAKAHERPWYLLSFERQTLLQYLAFLHLQQILRVFKQPQEAHLF